MIITLCGSARFEPWFHAWNEALSLSGHCVFGLAAYPSAYHETKEWYTPEQKKVLDAVHFGKIEASHAIVVLNVFAYMGESTLAEVAHARSKKKDVYFLESWGEGNGVDASHFESLRVASGSFAVPAGYVSPMDTYKSRLDVTSLFPPHGDLRRSITATLSRRLDGLKGLSTG